MINLLKELSLLSYQTLTASKQNEWDAAQDLQIKRELVMGKISKLEIPNDSKDIEFIKQLTDEIKHLDSEIYKLADAHKKALFNEIKSANKSKKMNNAYKQ